MLVPIGSGTSLDVADAGNGSAVVLLHGWPVTAVHWRSLLPALNRAGYRTLAIEARGFGDASTGAGDATKARLATEVIEVLDALGVRRIALIGHGMGGTVAALIAAAQPARIAAIVLEETVLPGTGIPLPVREQQADWLPSLMRAPGGVAEGLLHGRFDLAVDAYLTASAGPGGLDFDAHLAYVTTYGTDERIGPSLALFRAESEDAVAVQRAIRRRLRLPGLAIGGRYGGGQAVPESLARLVSGARGMIVPGAGAYPAEQAPEAVAGAVVRFLRAVT
jgi:pimeloyl-ACP methyl ester carboxylesterase